MGYLIETLFVFISTLKNIRFLVNPKKVSDSIPETLKRFLKDEK
jgi:hypothetical protein